MTSYEQIWPVAEDHYGIITTAKARELGVSKQSMSAMVQSGRLTRLGHGIYQVQHHVPGQNDVFAFANAAVREGAYLRGASVLYMLHLTAFYVGTPKRVRRRLPHGFRVRENTPCDTVEYEGYEGIRCQRLTDALESARADGSVELDRIADAAAAACEKGLFTDEECAKFQVQS